MAAIPISLRQRLFRFGELFCLQHGWRPGRKREQTHRSSRLPGRFHANIFTQCRSIQSPEPAAHQLRYRLPFWPLNNPQCGCQGPNSQESDSSSAFCLLMEGWSSRWSRAGSVKTPKSGHIAIRREVDTSLPDTAFRAAGRAVPSTSGQLPECRWSATCAAPNRVRYES
jgi:hypothetical protein